MQVECGASPKTCGASWVCALYAACHMEMSIRNSSWQASICMSNARLRRKSAARVWFPLGLFKSLLQHQHHHPCQHLPQRVILQHRCQPHHVHNIASISISIIIIIIIIFIIIISISISISIISMITALSASASSA